LKATNLIMEMILKAKITIAIWLILSSLKKMYKKILDKLFRKQKNSRDGIILINTLLNSNYFFAKNKQSKTQTLEWNVLKFRKLYFVKMVEIGLHFKHFKWMISKSKTWKKILSLDRMLILIIFSGENNIIWSTTYFNITKSL
jgi:hypothetical protein